MRAAYYEKNGSAADVLHIGEVETSRPGPGEVRVRLATSGVNPSDVKSRQGRARKIAYPRVIPHSDGAGTIDAVGEGVSAARVGERVWVWNGGTIHLAGRAPSGAPARPHQFRHRRVSRYPRDDSLSRNHACGSLGRR